MGLISFSFHSKNEGSKHTFNDDEDLTVNGDIKYLLTTMAMYNLPSLTLISAGGGGQPPPPSKFLR